MKYEDDKFIIYCNETDKRYLNKLISIITLRMPTIINFFKINFTGKIVIKLYENLQDYKTNLEDSFKKEAEIESVKQHCHIEPREYQEWMIANTEDGNINMQSLDLVKQIKGYETYTEEEFCYNACHEFTHLCQQQLSSESPGWFWEVLATVLGNPECQHITNEPFTLKDLNENFDKIDGYGAVYKIGIYLFSNYESSFILSLVHDNDKLYSVIEDVINKIHNPNPQDNLLK